MTTVAGYGYSLEQAARLVCALRWVCGRLSEMFEIWAAQAATEAAGDNSGNADRADNAGSAAEDGRADSAGDAASAGNAASAVALELRQLGRRLADHRAVLDGLQPDSERLAPWRRAAPSNPSLDGALGEIEASGDSSQRLGIALDLILPQLLDAYERIRERAAGHSDGALITAAATLGAELRGQRLVGGAGQNEREQLRSVVGSAERILASAGGLIPAESLCPQDWP